MPATISGIRNAATVSTITPSGEMESSAVSRRERGHWLQPRDEVHICLEDQRQRKWVEMQMAKNRHWANAASFPGASPFGFRPIAERRSNTVARISDPIHRSQNQLGGKSVKEVILDYERSPSHPLHLRH